MSLLASIRRCVRLGVCLGVLAGVAAVPVLAQDAPTTRAAELEAKRKAKAAATKPYQPDGLEKAIDFVENNRIIERLVATPQGFYPHFGSISRRSGFSLGLGYRRAGAFAGGTILDVWAAGALSKYGMVRGTLSMPHLAADHAFFEATGSVYDFPREEFYGLGADSRRTDQTTFAISGPVVSASGGFKPARRVRLGATVEYFDPRVRNGKTPDVPQIAGVFNPADVPGLLSQPDFVRVGVFAEADRRQPGLNARRGGYYLVDWSRFDDRSGTAFDFDRTRVDLRQYIPLFKEKRVIALRAYYSTSSTDDGSTVPFHLQDTLGGPDSLRGFREFRFRGPHVALVQAEYRIEIWPALDLGFFYERGQVALQRSDLHWSAFDDDYGVGLRFGTMNGVFMRVEGAFGGREGNRFILRFGNVF